MILIHLYITQCPEGPEYCFDWYNPESNAIQPDWHSEQCPNHSKYFSNLKKSELGAINCCTCQIMSGSSWILFWSVQPQIGCYSTQLTFETMSEPFQIFFKSEKVEIGYIHSLYVPNNVWMGLNIISISKTPNRSLFDPTEIPGIVWTIPNIF